ncbi:hypothetical protein [Actinoalloteichus caeruleus]|uniref:Transcriptional regulator n=1 Tax=Actinoalloteichus caeruleus DSM 43889 TaxID=1120930 RepID=A0ABT1JC53_ACTCY|nr:hypothetical protein [Actinoalloteichus caeruleus]MCP2329743.1 hypothetical protein [Actinoalloteichus caeruleus DSM 43889]
MHGNQDLRRLMAEAELSNTGLANAVVRTAAREGIHLGTTPTSVKRMLLGCQPRDPVPRLVAAALSRRLGYPVTVTACGFDDHRTAGDTFDALRRASTPGGTMGTVVELSGRDLNRRNFLLGSAFTASAFAEPAWLALTAPPPEATAAVGSGRRIGTAEIKVLGEMVRHYESLQRRFGGGQVRDRVVRFVHDEARVAAEATYSEQHGRELFSTLAQATWLAGLTTADSGRHALGQRYYAQALHLATQAGDTLFAANVLAEMSRLTIDIGNATSQATGAEHGPHAAALARSALRMTEGAATPRFAAWLHAIEARGLAFVGDARSARQAIEEAQRAFDRPGPPEPEWLAFYGEPDLISDVGQCLRDAGRPQQGLALLEQAAAALPEDRVTARAKTRIHIAAAHLELGDYDQAESVAGQAFADMGELSSARTVDRVVALRQRARGRGRHPALLDLDERITELVGERPSSGPGPAGVTP